MNLTIASPAKNAPPGRGFWAMRDIPTALWLVLTVIATLVHRNIPEPRWLMIHLLLLGAITHAILVWSNYFSFALLRSRATHADRRAQNVQLIFSNSGTALILTGVPLNLWPLTLAGAAGLLVAVGWHGLTLHRRLRASLAGRFGGVTRYYIAAAALLIVGGALGAIIARDGSANLVLAHGLINVLGWIGLTVAGTVITLWPTILRTRAAENAASGARHALIVLIIGIGTAALGAGFSWLPLLTLGLAIYLTGLVIIGIPLVKETVAAPPQSFAAFSVGMALVWWAGCLAYIVVMAAVAILDGSGFPTVITAFQEAVPFLAAGFAAQILVGALSYLVPVVLGGGPWPVKVGTAAFDRLGPARITMANAALVVCALPVSSWMRTVASILYLISLTTFLPIMVAGMRAQRLAKAEGPRSEGKTAPAAPLPGRHAGQAIAGLLAVLLAVAITAAADPVGLGWRSVPGGSQEAPVTTVQVEAADMSFTPNVIEVPKGNRLIVELTNADATQVHDLVFANGTGGKRLSPGESETIDVGVITEELEGWCSIVGHRQMGMTLTVIVAGEQASHDSQTPKADKTQTSSPVPLLHGQKPPADFTEFDATLPALPTSTEPTTHKITLDVTDTVVPVAPGVTQTLWTYNKTAPGPTLHGKVGDTFEVTLINSGTMGHSIDFHAGALAPDKPMRTIQPGERLTYTFTANRAGIWMYHCSTMPMTTHIANGMYGAVVIEDPKLPTVDHSYVLVQSEYYLGDHAAGEVDADKIATRNPDLVVFNGYANQYDHAPLTAKVGERVRVWVMNAGIERSTSFHVIGGQFDTVWAEGAYLLNRSTDTGSQALGLFPAQGGFVELTFPEAGHYPFVSHMMLDAERGAHGIFKVE